MYQDPIERLRQYQAVCKKALEHVRLKLVKQEREFIEANKCSWYQYIGDSLLAHPDLCPKGTAQCSIENIHSHEIEKVATNPKFNAYQNAQLFYKKARKGKRSLEIVARKVSESKEEIKQFEDLHTQIKALGDPAIAPEDVEKGLEKVIADLDVLGLVPKQTQALLAVKCRKQSLIAIIRLKDGTFTSVKTIFRTTS